MGEAVKLDVKNFAEANSSSKVNNTNSAYSSSKNSFSDILKYAGNSNNSSKDLKSSQTNGEQTARINDTADETSKKKSDLIQTKITDDDNSLQSDNEEGIQLTDEQKKELEKVKEILEKLMSGDKDSDNKIHALLAKIAKNLVASNITDTKKDAKLTDNIIEALLASMNINSAQFNQLLNSGSQSDAVSELKQDLNKLINLVTKDKSTVSDSFKQLDNKDNTVKSSDLKLNQLLADSNSADEDKLLAKIKQELSSLAAELKQTGAEKKADMSNKDSSPINIINISDNKSKASEQNADSKHESDSNSGQDDKFLNDLLSDNKDGQDDKISKVSNLFSQFSADNTSKTTAAAEVPIVTKTNFSADIVKSLKYMETNNFKDLTIKIMPKELGEVIIKITSDGGIMKASITAANKDTYNLLNSNLQDITKSLSNQDIKIQNVEINIYNGDTTFFSGNGNDKNGSDGSKRNKNLGNFSLDEIDSISDQDDVYDENNINALA